jgi:transposase
VGNRGYRRFLRVERGSVSIDRAKAKEEARYDARGSGPPKERTVRGKYVLGTDLSLDAGEIALKYKQLWRVERAFRTVKSVLETRPVYHKRDETIMGHVFASFRGARGDA